MAFRWKEGRLAFIAAATIGATLACAAPQVSTTAGASRLFIANAGDGTVAEVVATTGVLNGPPVVIGPGIQQLVTGTRGSLLVVSRHGGALETEPRREYRVTQLTQDRRGGWAQRAVSFGPAGGPDEEPLLANGGGRWAAIAFRRQAPDARGQDTPGGRCVVALLDGDTGAIRHEFAVCRAAETIRALAVNSRGQEPIIYAALEDQAARDGRAPGRLVALAGHTGNEFASVELWGTPLGLGFPPAHENTVRRVYSIEAHGGPEADPPEPYGGRVRAFNADTLGNEANYPLDIAPTHLAFVGDTIYLLDAYNVLSLDLLTGRLRLLARLPARGLALAADAERIYVATVYNGAVEVFNRANGMRGRPLRVGRNPVALALSGA